MQRETVKSVSVIILFFSLILIVAVSGCTSTGKAVFDNNSNCTESTACSLSQEKQLETPIEPIVVEKIEIYHFHGTTQCFTCKTVGDFAEETVKTFFAKELESGKIVFGHINRDLPENKELVKKYAVTGASLWIGTYTSDGKFNKEQNNNVWYKTGNKKEYLNYLKGIIEQKQSGDLS